MSYLSSGLYFQTVRSVCCNRKLHS